MQLFLSCPSAANCADGTTCGDWVAPVPDCCTSVDLCADGITTCANWVAEVPACCSSADNCADGIT